MNSQSLTQAIGQMQQRPLWIGGQVKGLTTMKDLKRFAYDVTCDYKQYNKDIEQYDLQVEDLPDFVQHEFAAKIMANDESYGSEATGPDNDAWDSKMLPALLRFLKNTTDKDEEIEFVKEWRDGVSSYFFGHMQELIDRSLEDINSWDGFDE